MKYSSALRGKKAERRCAFPVEGEDGKLVDLACVAVPLSGDDEGSAHEFARKFAKSKGVESGANGEAVYDLGYAAKIVHLGIRDPDSGTEGRREPTFASVEEVLSGLTRETITYLFTIVEEWCDECSPTMRQLSDAAMFAMAKKLSEEGDEASRFFDRCGPAMRKRFALFSARLLSTSLALSSSSGGTTESGGTTSPPTSTPSAP